MESVGSINSELEKLFLPDAYPETYEDASVIVSQRYFILSIRQNNDVIERMQKIYTPFFPIGNKLSTSY